METREMTPDEILEKYLSSSKLDKGWMKQMIYEVYRKGRIDAMTKVYYELPCPVVWYPKGYWVEAQDANNAHLRVRNNLWDEIMELKKIEGKK
jgi:hypothetical protein